MKICLIAEGSYPYILGGVSSWIQQLVTSMPQHEFVIYSIGAKKESKGRYAYQLPKNICQIEEVFLDEFGPEVNAFGRNFHLQKEEKAAIKSLLDETPTDWHLIFSLFTTGRIHDAAEFIMSRDVYEIIYEICLERYAHLPFTEMFWTMRSMLLPLFVVLKNPPPEADLYHSVSTGYAGAAGSIASFSREKPFILTEHGIYTREREEEIIKASWIKGYLKDMWIQYFHSMSSAAYTYAGTVISLFEKNKRIQIELGCKAEKIEIISNGVAIPDIPPKNHEHQSGLTIGAIVRIVPIKDIKTMIQSFSIVKQKHPDVKLLIMGPAGEDQDYYEECLELVEDLEVEDVIFTGAVKVQNYLPKIDVLVLSSISEGQPLAILEGLAMGIPYVATDVGSCKEILYGTANGPLVETGKRHQDGTGMQHQGVTGMQHQDEITMQHQDVTGMQHQDEITMQHQGVTGMQDQDETTMQHQGVTGMQHQDETARNRKNESGKNQGVTADDSGKAGFIVPVMHYMDMANRISELCESAQLRNQMGRIGRLRVQNKYTVDKFINSYAQLYENVVDEHGGSRI